MKQMWSKEQIEKIAKESGGSLPEILEGDAGKALVVNEQEDGVEWGEASAPDNVLVLPEEAPAAQQLVGINTSNEQNALNIGKGLVKQDDKLMAEYVGLTDKATISYSAQTKSFEPGLTRWSANSVTVPTGHSAPRGIFGFTYPMPTALLSTILDAGLQIVTTLSYAAYDSTNDSFTYAFYIIVYNPTSSAISITLSSAANISAVYA